MMKSKKTIGEVVFKNGLGTLLQWAYPLFQPFVIVLFLGLGYLFLTFNPDVEHPVYYPSWMVYWLTLIIFLLIFDLLMIFQVLFVYPYRLKKYDEKYRLEYYQKGEKKELEIHQFYHWWSYGWSTMEHPKSGEEMNLWEWLGSPTEKRRYERQTILFVGMIDESGKQVLLFQVLNSFENVPDGWAFKKGTRMMNGIKALKLKGFVEAVSQLKKT